MIFINVAYITKPDDIASEARPNLFHPGKLLFKFKCCRLMQFRHGEKSGFYGSGGLL